MTTAVTLWVEVGGVVLVCVCGSLALALARSAKRADAITERSPEVTEIARSLARLSTVRSPTGRRFYPTPHARRELAEMVYEAQKAGWGATR